jgi:hypothetical protein
MGPEKANTTRCGFLGLAKRQSWGWASLSRLDASLFILFFFGYSLY